MGATALGVLLLIAPGILGGAPGGAPATAPAGASGVSGTPCTGSHIATHFAGTLSAYHPYGAVPSVAGVNVTLQYVYQQNDSSPLGHTVACLPENVSAGTSPNGTFTLRPTVPAGNCSGVKSCIVNSGPFGPFAFRLNRSDPPGDFLRLSWAVGRVQLVWTSALAAVAVDPAGPVATSTGDPLGLTAKALAGDGGPSPANLTHAWTVSGAAWTLLGNRTGPTARVEANGSGGSGAAKVEVRGTYNGTALGPLDAVVDLSAIPTTMVTGTPSPSSVDVGQRLPVEVVADGSAGFSYGAQATPGLGERAQTLNCTTVPGSSADVVVDCKGGLVYDRAGLADPRVNVSNGFSSANWTLGNLTVAPSPAFAVDPDPAE
ncbi:MAG TPA: hypothetical protein VMH90_06205, partial [Thermoplasmata archaeon]|nr:hypothetical protein [Thermoplasmata archaeon]